MVDPIRSPASGHDFFLSFFLWVLRPNLINGLFCLFCFVATKLDRQLHQECLQVGTVIRKPGSTWLEGTPALDHGLEGKS